MQYDQYACTLNTPTYANNVRYSKLPDNICPTWSCPYTKLPDCVCVCVGVCAMPNSMSEITSEHISQHARVDCLQPLLLEYMCIMCAYNVRSLWCSCISNVSSQKNAKAHAESIQYQAGPKAQWKGSCAAKSVRSDERKLELPSTNRIKLQHPPGRIKTQLDHSIVPHHDHTFRICKHLPNTTHPYCTRVSGLLIDNYWLTLQNLIGNGFIIVTCSILFALAGLRVSL